MSTWSDLKHNQRLRKIYETRLGVIKIIREFFWSNGFVETDTPLAVRYPGQEPYLNPIPLKFHDPQGEEHGLYLQTSPEFAMKKLLAADFPKIFQICKCWRDFESFGGLHNTEFTMIEWYRSPGSLDEIMDDTERLFKFVAKNLDLRVLRFKDFKIDCDTVWDKASMREVWQEFLGVNLDNYLELDELNKLAIAKGYRAGARDAYEDVFYKIFLNEIESKLGIDRPVFVYDYPACMSSLSRLCEHDKRYAERFELYIGGLELANAFGELMDPEEQLRRLEGDKNKRQVLGKEIWPVDPEFIVALKEFSDQDLPGAALSTRGEAGAAGIALGVDRMVLLFTGAKDLNEVIFQSVNDQIHKNIKTLEH